MVEYILSEEMFSHINKGLENLLISTNAHMAMVLNMDGHKLATIGFVDDAEGMGALISGVFNAAQAISRILKEENGFKSFFQKGKEYTVYYSVIGGSLILSVIFDSSTLLGVIQVGVQELDKYLTEVFAKVPQVKPTEEVMLTEKDIKEAEERIDDIFDSLF